MHDASYLIVHGITGFNFFFNFKVGQFYLLRWKL